MGERKVGRAINGRPWPGHETIKLIRASKWRLCEAVFRWLQRRRRARVRRALEHPEQLVNQEIDKYQEIGGISREDERSGTTIHPCPLR